MSGQSTQPAPPHHAPTESSGNPAHEQIAVLAYLLWEARGCPEGTPAEDWFNAERTLKAKTEPWLLYH